MILKYEDIIGKILSSTSLPRDQIESKIEQKLKDLHDLISREGAAHIVANELSVKLFDNVNRTLKIKDLAPGLSSVNITARVVVWDDRLIDETKTLQEGNIIKISNAYSKLNNNNYSELHLGNKAQVVINPVNETVGEVRINMLSKKKNIKDLQPNEFVEVFGTIVEVFEPKFYQACPVCNKKVIFSNDSFSCQEHNQVTPKQVPIVNLILDDATDNIRVVCFRDVAEKIIGKDKPDFEIVKKDNKGRQIMVKGKVSKNEMFSRVELIASAVEELDPARIIQELELKQ